jgi:hypothetical protein
MNKVRQEIGGAAEGHHLHEQLYPKQMSDIRHQIHRKEK